MRVNGVPAVKALEVLMRPGADLLTLADFLASERPAWHAQAACRGMGPALFYPSGRGDKTGPARAVCADCPVVEECRDAGLNGPEGVEQGVWGGLTENGRKALGRADAA